MADHTERYFFIDAEDGSRYEAIETAPIRSSGAGGRTIGRRSVKTIDGWWVEYNPKTKKWRVQLPDGNWIDGISNYTPS